VKGFLIFVSVLFLFSVAAKAEDAKDHLKPGTTSMGVFADSGAGNAFSSSVQYFVAQGLFIKGGLSVYQSSVTSNGTSVDSKSNSLNLGFGEALPINSYTIATLTAAYVYFVTDYTSGGNTLPGSADGAGIGLGAYIEYFVNPRTSLGIGLAYRSLEGKYRDTGSSVSDSSSGLTTGWKFYF
jgi:hypothetical protein